MRAPAVPPYRAQLALLVAEAPEGAGWVHEVKCDGYRFGCALECGRATLWSRREKDWTAQFFEVAAAARALPVRSALFDGEVAALLPDGRTSFQALQNAFSGLSPRLRPGRLTLATVARRLRSLGRDPWEGYEAARRPLRVRSSSTTTSTST